MDIQQRLILKARIELVSNRKNSVKYYSDIEKICGQGKLINLTTLNQNALDELTQYFDNVEKKPKRK